MAGREQQGGTSLSSDPKNAQRGEQSAETVVLRDFGGVNVQSPREDIGDNEFAWLEELLPIGPGNLVPVLGPGGALAVVASETGAPTLVASYVGASVGRVPVLQNVDNVLAVWANSGNAWIISSGVATKIATGLFTSGQTAVAPWSDVGVLIVDPTAGYYDYSVTAQDTLTNLSGQLYGPAVSNPASAALLSRTVPALTVTDVAGTGGAVGASASVTSATIGAAGTGYLPGDVLTATGGTLTTSSAAPAAQQNQPLLITVLTVSGSAVTGISITSPGYYQTGPANSIAFTGGSGSGFTASVGWLIGNPFVITAGSGYVAPVVKSGGVAFPISVFTSGSLRGTAIATYSGRVWIAIGRTVQFTDALSYNSFANSGSSFTITDSYLHKTITALYAANNYLYIFGDDSIDILSNVTVVNGIAQFSRVNASSSVGTTQPLSIFPYLRGLAFANPSGFYVISGATPEKVSDDLDNLIAATDFTKPIYGCQVMVANILCAAFVIYFADSFVNTPTLSRAIIVILFRGKWWFTSQRPASGVNLSSIISYPVNGLSTMFGWAGNAFYPLLSATNANNWLLQTKLWDAQTPILDKQAITAGIGVVLRGGAVSGFTVNVDDEYATVVTNIGNPLPLVQWVNNAGARITWVNNAGATVSWLLSPAGYEFFIGAANAGGGKYLGLSATGTANTKQIRLLAIEMERRRRW